MRKSHANQGGNLHLPLQNQHLPVPGKAACLSAQEFRDKSRLILEVHRTIPDSSPEILKLPSWEYPPPFTDRLPHAVAQTTSSYRR